MASNKPIYDTVDIIIIGAGLTGCYLLNKLLHKYPNKKILLIESASRIGGRVETVKFTDTDGLKIQYEAGGARFSDKHKRVTKLLHELGLHNTKNVIPISSDVMHITFKNNSNNAELLFKNNHIISESGLKLPVTDIIDIIKHIKRFIKSNEIADSVIKNHTLYTFIKDVMTDSKLAEYMVGFYEYYSELAVLNMSLALKIFITEFNSSVQYYVLKSGYESIITRLTNNANLKKHIKLNTHVTQITYKGTDDTNGEQIFIIDTLNDMGNKITYTAKTVICSVTIDALRKIKLTLPEKTRDHIMKTCNSIKTEPLYRIYARFNKPLPDMLPKVATNLPIKYIIPMDHKNGIIMLSYTDGIYANKIHKLNQSDLLNDTNKLSKLLMNNFNKLLPYITEDREITKYEEPIWIKHHYWHSGAGYWKPGELPELSDVIQPAANISLFLTGEQISMHQAWIEGCLETADIVIRKITSLHRIHNTRKFIGFKTKKKNLPMKQKNGGAVKKFTKDEVAKHNKPDDAWIIINNKVYNITNWINKHPGGNVILQGIGKDATALFNNKGGGSGHSASAHKILSKYYIGNLGNLDG